MRVDPIHGLAPTRIGKKKPQPMPSSRLPPDHGMDFGKMVRPSDVLLLAPINKIRRRCGRNCPIARTNDFRMLPAPLCLEKTGETRKTFVHRRLTSLVFALLEPWMISTMPTIAARAAAAVRPPAQEGRRGDRPLRAPQHDALFGGRRNAPRSLPRIITSARLGNLSRLIADRAPLDVGAARTILEIVARARGLAPPA